MAAEAIGISIAASIISKITATVKPAKRQLIYMFCFKSFVRDLMKHKNSVEEAHSRVKSAVDAAKSNAEEIHKDVQTWLTDVNTTMDHVNSLKEEIEQDKKCFTKWCPFWQYRLSRRVAKKTIDLKNLKMNSTFQNVSYRAATPHYEFSSKDFILSDSSKLAFNQIMKALTDDKVHIIGLRGMGGVGKTTLVKEVAKKAIELKLFEDVAMVVVSRNLDCKYIQDQIAEKLGLKLEGKSEQARANLLGQRLQDEKKKLLILDDMWEYGQLEKMNAIGIPLGPEHKNSKILLTTRRKHVCSSCQKQILLDVLTKEEAWNLFKINAGLSDDSPTLNKAEEVVGECKGLPIAIVTVGRALKGKNLNAWEVAIRKLKNSELPGIRDVDEKNAYACLKLSYDELQPVETKLCFLLCSLFPEDYEILVEDLARYAIGLGWFTDSQSIQVARSEMLDAIDELTTSSMLLDGKKKGCVKMHDLVRDVALWICRNFENISQLRREFKVEACIGLEKQLSIGRSQCCTAIYLKDTEFPTGLVNPKLEILLARKSKESYRGKSKVSDGEDFMNVSEAALKGIKELKVLSITRGSLSIQSLEFLTNLQILELKYCRVNFLTSKEDDNNLTSFQKLSSLKVLSFYGSSIAELPHEIGELSGLKVLDLRNCFGLESIPRTIVRKLLKLEELYIEKGSFHQWQVEGMDKNKSNVSLTELNSLSHLAILWLDLNEENIPRDFVFPKLIGYRVHISCGFDRHYKDPDPLLRYPTYPTSRFLCFKPSNVATINACKKLFSNVYDLRVWNNGECFHNIVPDMDQSGFGELISLKLVDCKMECLISTEQQQMPTFYQQKAFSNLEELRLWKVNLREICHGNPPKGFMEKLREVFVKNVNEMLTIFPTKLWRALKVLETVTVDDCDDLQEVFNLDGLDEVTEEMLSHLTTLELKNLRDLNHIWKEPSTCCLSLKNLKSICIEACNKLKRLFPITVAQGLPCLERLWVSECCQLVALFGSEDGAEVDDDREDILFSQLLGLKLEKLPSVINLRPSGYHFKLPRLRELDVKDCPKIATNVTIAPNNEIGDSREIQLRSIIACNCDELKHIIAVTKNDEEQKNLISFRSDISATSFINLNTIEIENCNNLKSLFPITIAQGLPCLDYLSIVECSQLVEVFGATDDTENNDEKEMVLPNLRSLSLSHLRSLISFCPRDYHFVLPRLQKLNVEECPKIVANFTATPNQNADSETEASTSRERLTIKAPLRRINVKEGHELEQIIAVAKEEDDKKNEIITLRSDSPPNVFVNLLQIEVRQCNKLKSLFPITIAQGLPKLESITVSGCNQLVEVFGANEDEGGVKENIIELPELLKLELEGLPSLINFCPIGYHFIFPRLSYMKLHKCPRTATTFFVAPDEILHAKTKATQVINEETTTMPEAIHAPLGSNHQDIEWKRQHPFYFGDDYHGKVREDEDNDGEEKEFKEEDGERTT